MNNALNLIIAQRWAILPESLEALLDIVQRKNITVDPELFHKNPDYEFSPTDRKVLALSREGRVLSQGGAPLQDAPRVLRVGRTALVPIIGPIFPRENLMTLSGATSISAITNDLSAALNDTRVEKIILEIDDQQCG